MNRNRIIGAVLALGLLAGGGFGFKAMAQSNLTTQTPQSQGQIYQGGMMNGNFGGMMNGNFGNNFGGFMRGMRGFWNGNQGPELTQDQQKEVNNLRTQLQNLMVDYRDQMVQAREKLTNAITSGIKTDILSAWEEMKALQLDVQAKVKPTKDQIAAIVGIDQDALDFMTENFQNSYMSQQMDQLKNAATDEAAKTIIDGLQGDRGFGFNGPGMMNRNGGTGFGGFGGGCQGRGFRR